MRKFKIDGITLEILPPDLDGDGKIGGVETLVQQSSIDTQNITHPTEVGEALTHLNDSSIELDTRMSRIDVNTRLHSVVIPSASVFETLIRTQFFPQKMGSFTIQLKRNLVSKDGEGRKEAVQIVGGKQERDERKGGFIQGAKNMLGLGAKNV